MNDSHLHVVTGAFGYTGRHIAARLLAEGKRVRTLVRRSRRPNPFGSSVEVAALDFERPEALREGLQGAVTLYNTYWLRFPYRGASFPQAVTHSQALFQAAGAAGVQRIVHISVTHASSDSPLPYFKGKGEVEQALAASGVPYAIVRPTVIFGRGDILINNIAWLVRRFPLFAIPGSGDYRLQPVYVEDVAALAVEAGRTTGNRVIDAVGAEVFSYQELVGLIARAVGARTKLIHLSPSLTLLLGKLVGLWVRDVVLTQEELAGLMANLLVSEAPPTGRTRFSLWLQENKDSVGREYASELERHYR